MYTVCTYADDSHEFNTNDKCLYSSLRYTDLKGLMYKYRLMSSSGHGLCTTESDF